MGRWRIRIPAIVLAVVALSCSNHDPAAVEAARNGDSSPTTAAAGGGGDKPGVFGTLTDPVCGPGSATASSAQGVSSTIKVGVLGDANNTLIPDVNKELYDASTAFVSWCNAAGGINGRKIELTERDAGLLKAREVMTEACAQDFAVVGGGLALDFQSVETRTSCGLPEFPGFANTVDAREAALQVQAIPAYKTQWPTTQYVQIAKAFPDAVKSFGVMLTSAQLGSGRPYDQRLMDALRPLGYSMAYKADLPAPPVPVDNWRPYVEEMKGKGVKVLDFSVTPEYLVPLLRTMRDVGWYPEAIVLPGNFYSPALLEAGDALRGTYVNQYIHPFELADRNPPTKQFLAIMDAGAPGWRKGGLTVNSFSAWLLFAKAAKACGDQLTRDCVLRNGLGVGTWDGGGLHAPGKPDTKANPQPELCGILLKAEPSGFTIDEAKTAANKGIYNCATQNAPRVGL